MLIIEVGEEVIQTTLLVHGPLGGRGSGVAGHQQSDQVVAGLSGLNESKITVSC
jgi:hypothetical protein